jgi:hypothetical protein
MIGTHCPVRAIRPAVKAWTRAQSASVGPLLCCVNVCQQLLDTHVFLRGQGTVTLPYYGLAVRRIILYRPDRSAPAIVSVVAWHSELL